MSTVNWSEILGWNAEQLEELRLAGFSYLKEGHYEKALLFFKALTVIDPQNLYDHQTLGALYLQMGKDDLALEILDKALNLDPKDETTQLNKVKTLLSLAKKQEALKILAPLAKSTDPSISGDATALLTTYT
ncbi:MAG: tetratricopeptide repeat protein [Chlamydiia bacterium]|nr:tetratricopeptide repeat protein [Chlamydiia bacterium]